MPPVTAPMTGRTLAATTTSSVSPKSSGLSNVFLPRFTKIRREHLGKKYNKHKKVVPTESMDWGRARLRLVEGFFDRLIGKRQAVPAPTPAVKPVGVSQAPARPPVAPKPKRNYGIPELTPAEKKAWRPGKNEPVRTDAQGNLVVDPDYEGVVSPAAWGKDAPKEGPADAEPLPGQYGHEDPNARRRRLLSLSGVSRGGASAGSGSNYTQSLPRHVGSSGDVQLVPPTSSQTFVRSRSRSGVSDRIDPAD